MTSLKKKNGFSLLHKLFRSIIYHGDITNINIINKKKKNYYTHTIGFYKEARKKREKKREKEYY
jgi:hypothetical protein